MSTAATPRESATPGDNPIVRVETIFFLRNGAVAMLG